MDRQYDLLQRLDRDLLSSSKSKVATRKFSVMVLQLEGDVGKFHYVVGDVEYNRILFKK